MTRTAEPTSEPSYASLSVSLSPALTLRIVQPAEGRDASAAETDAAESEKESDTSAVIATTGEAGRRM